MPQYDFRSPRLHVTGALKPGAEITLEKSQAHYLRNVLRLKTGDGVLAFNGKDGEWQATLGDGKRPVLILEKQTRPQTEPQDLHYLFAPLKHERLDYMVQKAVEMGVSRLQPVLTRHTRSSASTSSACTPMPSKPPSSAASCRFPKSASR